MITTAVTDDNPLVTGLNKHITKSSCFCADFSVEIIWNYMTDIFSNNFLSGSAKQIHISSLYFYLSMHSFLLLPYVAELAEKLNVLILF